MEEEIRKVASQLVDECSVGVYKDIHSMKADIERIFDTLEDHARQRTSSHVALHSSLKELAKWFEKHDKNEMDKYDQMAQKYSDLTDEIKSFIIMARDNNEYIEKEKADIEKEEYAKQKISELNKPREELWHKIKMTAVGVLTTAVVSSVLTGMYFLIKLVNSPTGQAIIGG